MEDQGQKLVEVTFKKPHRHGGQDYKKGEKAKVTPRAKEKLEKLGVI